MILLSFLVIACGSFAGLIWALKPEPAAEHVRARLASVRCAYVTPQEQKNPELDQSRRHRIEDRLLRTGVGRRLGDLLLQSRSGRSVPVFLGICAVVALAMGGIGGMISGRAFLAMGAAVLGMFAYPFLLNVQRSRRVERFAAQLPTAATMMARALRAGHSVPQMLELAADQSKDPLRQDFAQLSREQRLGVPLREALLALSQRVPLPDLRFLVSAILIQKETGGDLIQILERTAALIEERLRIRRQIQTYTAQGRMSAWVLTGLPVALLLLLSAVMPGYASTLFGEPAGQHLLYTGAVLLALGALIIRRIVNIRM